ncbi:hypothetical protein FDO65_03010 [Nakamurella flava]|uniref:Uncharacterized protein n=1 Tax=Nakamurella flava TaxID=2576308 RepID=A0A4U6QJL9_9ACTN|nr:hypothetical protein [Nakamurella flava]TKV60677.1 hypothetical protein FDO65_03010 [Nakamurella flava]
MSDHRRQARSRPPFAAVVDGLRRRPPAPERDRRARLRAPDGRVFVEIDPDLIPDAAVDLVAGGASVAWDSCGCRGYCGIEWFDADDTAVLVRSGPPVFVPASRKVPHAAGRLSAWHTDDGQVLVLASGEVRWGGLLS